MIALIVAAGCGSRLKTCTDDMPKTLLPFGRGVLLDVILSNLQKAGADSIVIVTGWRGEHIVRHIKNNPPPVPVHFARNEQWELGNGLSVLAAKPLLKDEPFLMAMSDHLVSPDAIKCLINAPGGDALLVDPDVDGNFDIDDATKVLFDPDPDEMHPAKQGRIIDIGKEIALYNAIDCGVFRLTGAFFDAMREALAEGQDSISAGVRRLINLGNMDAVLFREPSFWLDVDTPEAYAEAKRRYL